ncbi:MULTISPECIES: cytochrome c [Thauera]|jgi:cytochrome c556|uniref:Cytochrome c n=2 Tax=Thauera aminoaromatica TaxID=164330 RepID=C4ZP15_THASP|nr:MULTISPECIES: cytochrome c [Thauera]MDA0234334.1 cytochrome c [Pseudomonadota bacterium]OPZ04048.1 MAG: Cytochrome c' [Alphaproteobacteria bacterium ADurb.BinA305]ACK54773.1 cytochrome c prime [Thauera aminoaromatica]ENO87523.1 cytochrome C prime [Thauera aminoaromatica S2]KIN91746.1 cytochrome C' family protein [Thauera sp. SWB20]
MSRQPLARILLLALPAVLLLACSSEPPDTHPDKPVTQRRDAFKAMLRSTEPMNTMLKDRRFDADQFASLAEQLAAKRDAPWKHFGPGSNYPPTKARPAVWEKPAEFERRRSEFITATDRLLAAAAARSEEQARTALAAVQDSCKACHNDFRR